MGVSRQIFSTWVLDPCRLCRTQEALTSRGRSPPFVGASMFLDRPAVTWNKGDETCRGRGELAAMPLNRPTTSSRTLTTASYWIDPYSAHPKRRSKLAPLYMHLSIYIYIHIKCVYMYLYMYVNLCTICVYLYIHIYLSVHRCTYVYTYTHTSHYITLHCIYIT